MKILLVAEYREGKLLEQLSRTDRLCRQRWGPNSAMFLVGSDAAAARTSSGRLYLAEAAACGEYNPDVHKQLLLEVIAKEQPEMIVFCHSSYGWDLAPRIAVALKAAQISEVVAVADGGLVVPACNAKLRRNVRCSGTVTVVTLQAGAFCSGRSADRHSDGRDD